MNKINTHTKPNTESNKSLIHDLAIEQFVQMFVRMPVCIHIYTHVCEREIQCMGASVFVCWCESLWMCFSESAFIWIEVHHSKKPPRLNHWAGQSPRRAHLEEAITAGFQAWGHQPNIKPGQDSRKQSPKGERTLPWLGRQLKVHLNWDAQGKQKEPNMAYQPLPGHLSLPVYRHFWIFLS